MGRKRQRSKHSRAAIVAAFKGLPPAGCLNPDKQRFGSLSAAAKAADRLYYSEDRKLTPYPCGDHYHLTSKREEDPERE